VHSVFFVAFMFFILYDPPSTKRGPCKLRIKKDWPEKIMNWTSRTTFPESTGALKRAFFGQGNWIQVLEETAPRWFKDTQRSDKYFELLIAMFNKIWFKIEGAHEWIPNDISVTPEALITAIDEYVAQL
jgi:hypothetical protein